MLYLGVMNIKEQDFTQIGKMSVRTIRDYYPLNCCDGSIELNADFIVAKSVSMDD